MSAAVGFGLCSLTDEVNSLSDNQILNIVGRWLMPQVADGDGIWEFVRYLG